MSGLGLKVPKSVFEKGREAYKTNPNGGFADDVELTPGRHVAIVTGARGVTTDKGNSIVIDCKIAGESEQAGGRVSVWYSLDEERIVHLFRTLTMLGYDVGDLDEKMLVEIMADLKENTPVVRLTAKQKGEYVNVYIDKKLDDVEASDSGGSSAADADAGGGKAGIKKGAHAKADDLEDMDRDALKAVVEEEEVEIAIKKSVSDDAIREAIRTKRSEKPGKEEKEEKAKDDLDEKDRGELKDIIEEEEIELAVKKATTEDEMRAAIREHRESKAGGTEPDPKASEQSVEIEIGMSVKAIIKGKKVDAKVVSIDEKKGELKVKTKDGAIHKVTPDDLELE
jgi:hypothetical protein